MAEKAAELSLPASQPACRRSCPADPRSGSAAGEAGAGPPDESTGPEDRSSEALGETGLALRCRLEGLYADAEAAVVTALACRNGAAAAVASSGSKAADESCTGHAAAAVAHAEGEDGATRAKAALRALADACVTAPVLRESGLGRRARGLAKRAAASGDAALAAVAEAVVAAWRAQVLQEEQPD